MINDDEFVSVDLVKACNIVLTVLFEQLHSLCINSMGSLALRAKLAITFQKVLAHVELSARCVESAGTMLTIPFVVVMTYLWKQVGVILQ